MVNIGFAPGIGAASNFKYLTQISPKYKEIAQKQKEQVLNEKI